MKTYLDCIPCFFKQALEAARLAGANQRTQKRILEKLALAIPGISLSSSPPEIGQVIYGIVEKITHKDDPFKKIKEKSNRLALEIYPDLRNKVLSASDRLLMALELAIAGNIIDYGVKNSLSIEKELKRILNKENETIEKKNKAIFDYFEFKRSLNRAKTIIYLADNAGETVFDRILIEEIRRIDKNKRIIYTVKKRPIINDALIEVVKSVAPEFVIFFILMIIILGFLQQAELLLGIIQAGGIPIAAFTLGVLSGFNITGGSTLGVILFLIGVLLAGAGP